MVIVMVLMKGAAVGVRGQCEGQEGATLSFHRTNDDP